MKKEDIDRLILAIRNNEIDVVLAYAGVENIEEILDTVTEDDEKLRRIAITPQEANTLKIYRRIMPKIEEGDYDYFFSLIRNGVLSLFPLLLVSTKVDDMKTIISEHGKLGMYSSYMAKLILATQDLEYIKESIKNGKDLELSSYDVMRLILGTQGIKQDIGYIKSCITNREELGLNSWHLIDLIIVTQDETYIEQCIGERNELGLKNPREVKLLIFALKNPQNITKYIEDRYIYGLENEEICELILGTEDSQYIKQCIEKGQELGLDSCDIKELILAINIPQYIKQCIEKGQELGLDSYDLEELILETRDLQYIEQCIKRGNELGLDSENIEALISEIQDPEYIESCKKGRKRLDDEKGESNTGAKERISLKDVGYIVFSGEKPLDGTDYIQGIQILTLHFEMEKPDGLEP